MIRPLSREKILNLLATGEQSKFDWKRDIDLSSSLKKDELIKDVVAMANSHDTDTGVILYGVNPEAAKPEEQFPGITIHVDDASLQQLINAAVDRPIEFLYYEECSFFKPIGVLVIPYSKRRPHVVCRDSKKGGPLKAGTIPIRQGSSTRFAMYHDLHLMFSESEASTPEEKRKRLKELLYNSATRVSVLALAAWELVRAVGREKDEKWLYCELYGYPDRDAVPGHRIIDGNIRTHVPPYWSNAKELAPGRDEYLTWRRIVFSQPLTELEGIAERGDRNDRRGVWYIRRPASYFLPDGKSDQVVYFFYPATSFNAIFSYVRERIMGILIEIEKDAS